MNRKEIVIALIKILKENQIILGEEVGEITEKTRPIGDLSKFDSLMGVDVTVICCTKFGIDADKKIISLFVGENDKGFPYALNIGQIADLVLTLAN
jgi:hypothetical protein